ncbi:MAG: hypothetical protein HC915_19860 [Anaerolineae bacterium]|nr:hypothetical protein [Anaerolineae bacterium]
MSAFTRLITHAEPEAALARRWRAGILAGLALLSVAVYGVLAQQGNPLGWGFPLDDSWIHQTYARNLAQHGEWAYTPGTPSTASTAPLYTVLLALGHVLGLSPSSGRTCWAGWPWPEPGSSGRTWRCSSSRWSASARCCATSAG